MEGLHTKVAIDKCLQNSAVLPRCTRPNLSHYSAAATQRVKMEYSIALHCLLTQLEQKRVGEITNCRSVQRVLLHMCG